MTESDRVVFMREPQFVTEPGHAVSDEAKERCRNDIGILRSIGLDPYLVRVHPGDREPQYYFNFPPNEPSYLLRKKLAANHFEVDQEMGDTMLAFYASKASRKVGSWD
jgi:hypothetical protein